MEVKIISKKENPLLERREVGFKIEQGLQMKTPLRLEVRKALAIELKVSDDLVFVKRMQTLTGTHTTVGVANVYETVEQAKFIEPEYILKRNSPPVQPKEEVA
jgi:small subunit ribosomal protein S24e